MMMLLPNVLMREKAGRGRAVDYVLPRGHVCGWGLAKGGVLRVVRGRVWVTQAGDSGDYVLGAGERFVASRPGRVVVEALGGVAEIAV
jgi:hypothetical protein